MGEIAEGDCLAYRKSLLLSTAFIPTAVLAIKSAYSAEEYELSTSHSDIDVESLPPNRKKIADLVK